jgi:hypothetical protein
MYRLHEEMLKHPEHWNYNATGGAIKMAGDHSFPQPADGMLTFNFSTSANRDFWASACINMTKVGRRGRKERAAPLNADIAAECVARWHAPLVSLAAFNPSLSSDGLH